MKYIPRALVISTLGAVAVGALVSCGLHDGRSDDTVRIELLAPQVLTAPAQSADPAMAIDPETGDLLMAWIGEVEGVWNLYFARSSDGGGSFNPAVRVNDIAGDVHPHAEGAPRLVAGPGATGLFWNNQFEVEGRAFGASDLQFSRSEDGGATWEPTRSIQDDTVGVLPRANTFHGAAWTGDSTFVVAWLDGRDRDARRVDRAEDLGVSRDQAMQDPEAYADPEDLHDGDASVYAAYSHDLGRTWEPANQRVQEGICPCCRVALVGRSDGAIYGAWRQNLPGSLRDPAFRRLDDAEAELVRIHADEWHYPGCPHSGPGLDVDRDGTVHAAWYTGADGRMGIHYARMAPEVEAFSAPTPVVVGESIPIGHPAVVALPSGGAVVAHNVDGAGQRVIVLTGLSPGMDRIFQETIPESEGGTHPQLILLRDGRVLLAWTQSRDGVQRVRVARLQPGGAIQ